MQKIWLKDIELAARYGQSRVTPWRRVRAGMLPPPIRLSAGCTRWPAHEIEAIDSARLAGADDEGIRKLVVELVAARTARVAA